MSDHPSRQRLSYPEAESAQPWLVALLDIYHAIDQGVQEAVRREAPQGRRLACGRGCAACCRPHQDIPVYPLELMGLYWYCIEQVGGSFTGACAASWPATKGSGPVPSWWTRPVVGIP